MLKKTINSVDFNNVERSEDYYFNLTKAELTEMQLSTVGGFDEMIQKIVSAQDEPSIIKIFKEVILRSYGEKSADGRRFIKSDEIREAFEQTNAYSTLFMELITDDKAAADFILGILPTDLAAEVASSGVLPAEVTSSESLPMA